MATLNAGQLAGNFKDVATLTGQKILVGSIVRLFDGSQYFTSLIDEGGAVPLANGVFANPMAYIPDPQTATNTAAIATLKADNPNNQTGTAYTLALGDENKTVWMNNAAANTVTIPLNVTEAFGIDTLIMVMREGAGITSIQAAVGVTLNGIDGGFVDIAAINSGATLVKRGVDTWVVTGNISVVA